jgi:hypothetical protein
MMLSDRLPSTMRVFARNPYLARKTVRAGLLLSLSAWLVCFGGACATSVPIERASAPSPTTAGTDGRHLETPAEAPEVEAVSRTGSAPTGNESLDFARAVLEHEAEQKLSLAQRERVAHTLVVAEAEHGLPVALSLAIIKQESGFDPSAKGPAGSIGLMQLQPATARETARRHGLSWESNRTLLDPEQNARLGLAYLAELQSRFGTTEHAVAAYNIGPGNLRRLLARRPLRPGPYLTKIYAHVDALREEYGGEEYGAETGATSGREFRE